jgi:hypothetical protein
MYAFGNRRGRIHVTENHRMLWVGQYHSTRKDKEKLRWETLAQDGVPSSGANLLLASHGDGSTSHFTESEIWISTMLAADANYSERHDCYHLQVSKIRKREKVRELLGCSGIVSPVRKGHTLEVESWSTVRVDKSLLLTGKQLHPELLGDNQLSTFVAALAFWTGSITKSNTVMWSTSDRQQADAIQARLVRGGYEAKISVNKCSSRNAKHRDNYVLHITATPRVRLRKGIDVTSYNYSGRVGCVTVPSGYILVRNAGQTFVTGNCALEPVCLAECSKDKALLSVYGKDAKPNDIYLFVGAQLDGMKQYFLPHGYDPYNPTPEAIKKCKKEAKNWRSVAKCLYLSSGYGAGPKKIRESLALSGIELSFQQVKDMHSAYWNLFSGIKRLEKYLQNQWEKNGGWFLNGIGRPVCVDQQVLKDCVNRNIQSTGHDNLLIYLWLLRKHLETEGIPFNPIIWDLHDAVFLEVPDEWVARTKELINVVVLNEFNTLIGAKQVTLKLEANVVDSFAEDKVENLVEARERWALDVQMLDEQEE